MIHWLVTIVWTPKDGDANVWLMRHTRKGFEARSYRDDQIRRTDRATMAGLQTSGSQPVTDGMTISAMHGEMVGTVTESNTSAEYCTHGADNRASALVDLTRRVSMSANAPRHLHDAAPPRGRVC